MKFSVICPVYNSEKYLDRCICSVLKQTYQNWQLVLVNDGSNDSSYDICSKYQIYDARILVINKKNTGAGDSRNCGINVAVGDYLLFLDSDDELSPDYLLNIEKCISEKGQFDVICTNFSTIKGKKEVNTILNDTEKYFYNNECFINFIKNKNIQSGPCCKAFRKDFIVLNSLRFPLFRAREDTYFLINVFKYCKSLYLAPFFGYRIYLSKNSIERSKYSNTKVKLLESGLLAIKYCMEIDKSALNFAYKYYFDLINFCAVEFSLEGNMVSNIDSYNILKESIENIYNIDSSYSNLFLKIFCKYFFVAKIIAKCGRILRKL